MVSITVSIAVSVVCWFRFGVTMIPLVSSRCFDGFGGSGDFVPLVSSRWFRSDGFVSVFRVLVHSILQRKD